MDYNICLQNCAPYQVLSLNNAINDISLLKVLDTCANAYNLENLQYSYSTDGVCWSCFNNFANTITLLDGIISDFYIKVKIAGNIGLVYYDNEITKEYTVQIASGFEFKSGLEQVNTNIYNPYANLECAMGLYQQLTETVSNIVGIPIYYFKLSGNEGARDLTFKEYALMNVSAVKQIKLIVNGNEMPSSKPEFSDWGMDFQTDWQTEISKASFATAFGNNAQPQEGDLIYIPMMKRMWMVNEAYEEKKNGFMWNATTFTLALTKYQEKGSVDLGDTEDLVNSFVKNKYDDLFGDDENIGAEEATNDSPNSCANGLYPVFQSDATRKYVTCLNTDLTNIQRYQKGTLITDYCYDFSFGADNTQVIYQHQYCGNNGTCSFIITPNNAIYEGIICKIAGLQIQIKQSNGSTLLSLINVPSIKLDNLTAGECYFIYLRWSESLNIIEMSAAKYTYPIGIPLYKLQNHHYYFDIDNAVKSVAVYNIEMHQEEKKEVYIGKINGTITNFKLFDDYINNISEILMMYPTNKHLVINDTARKLIDLNGISIQ